MGRLTTTHILNLSADRITYRAVNCCIRFVPTVEGKEVVTVECVKAAE